MSGAATDTLPAEVLHAYGFDDAAVQASAGGLINRTWILREPSGRRWVLQAVNPIFPPAINADIDALTRHLAGKGVMTPELVASRDRALWVEHETQIYRVMTMIDGVTRDALEHPPQAREAGLALARFHVAVSDFAAPLSNARLGVHDTARHLAALRETLETHAGHAGHPRVAALARGIFELAAGVALPAEMPDRVVHGDPKISNIVFDPHSDEALALIDLDTLARMPIALELGDAFRSWCNPHREDAAQAVFSLPLFEAAIEGYAEAGRGLLMPAEWQSIPAAVRLISLELAARFGADALRERYFKWDGRRYRSATEHNLARTRSQLTVARAVAGQQAAMERVVAAAFG